MGSEWRDKDVPRFRKRIKRNGRVLARVRVAHHS